MGYTFFLFINNGLKMSKNFYKINHLDSNVVKILNTNIVPLDPFKTFCKEI